MDKGTRVKIAKGKSGVGQRGVVFWSGPSKFGTGQRIGVRTDAGEKVWTTPQDVVVEGGSGHDSGGPRFFGFDAADWHDESEYTVAFDEEPDARAQERIAESFLGCGIGFGYRSRFLWSRRLLMFSAGARSRGAVRRWATELSRDVKIVDVVFQGIREGDIEPGEPAPQPRSKTWAFGIRPFDESLPEWRAREEFDRIRIEVSQRASREREAPELDKALEKQKAKNAVRFVRDDCCSPPSITDSRFDVFEVPAARTTFFEGNLQGAEQQASAGDHPIVDLYPETVARVVREARPTGSVFEAFAYEKDGQRKEVQVVEGLDISGVSLHPTESRALVTTAGMVLELDLETETVTLLPRAGMPAQAVYLADGYWVSLGGPIALFDADNQLVDCPKGAGRWGRVFAEGRGLLVGDGVSLRVFGLSHGKLQQLGELPKARGWPKYCPTDGDPAVELLGGVVRAEGAAMAVAALATKKPSRRKAQPLKVLRFEPMSTVPIQEKSEAREPPVEGATSFSWSPNGEWAAFRKAGDPWLHVLGPEGVLEEADYEPDVFAIDDEGTVCAYSITGVRWRWHPSTKGQPKPKPGWAWPGVEHRPDRAQRVDLLPSHDAMALHFKHRGEFSIFARRGDEIVDVWSGRGFSRFYEVGSDLIAEGALGVFRVRGI